MDRRFIIAIALTTIVVLLVPRIFPAPAAKRPIPAGRAAVGARAAGAPAAGTPATVGVAGARIDSLSPAGAAVAAPGTLGTLGGTDTSAAGRAAATVDTITVATGRVVYRFSTVGAMPVGALLPGYRSLANRARQVELAREGMPLLRFRLLAGTDTVPLDRMPFAVDTVAGVGRGAAPLVFRAPVGPASEAIITYTFAPDSYLVRVSGEVTGARGGALLITLPNGVRSEEVDSLDDIRHLAYVAKPVRDDARSIAFASLDTARAQTERDGPYTWVASKNKYFLVALLTPDSAMSAAACARTGDAAAAQACAAARPRPFTDLAIAPALRAKRDPALNAAATITQPLASGRFAFEMYTGPQEWRRLRAIGRDFDHVNPYGGWLRGFVQPFATICMRMLLWMHDQLKLSYGWVLVIFGIAVRLILWPLNQSAMRSSLKMQALQPEMQEIQKRLGSDPQKQQAAMMELYRKHKMSPMSPVLGCLPMLIPMPVLFALFFVFQNTIEFRGVPFLWLGDISQKDPYYILPVLMAVSMYLLSWIGMRNAPPNPQAKMMSYMLPGVMLFALHNLASGLNLYYAVQNLASLPQQWLIAKERAKTTPAKAVPVAAPRVAKG
ncbi:MAG: YidC/Oxa1 family insertase periplasmic-domain containing protein [Gemmatimonadaceae bacterium]